MKISVCMLIALLGVPAFAEPPALDQSAVQHSGGTDRNGCHRDHKNGGRHCH